MARATYNGVVIAESDDIVVVEGNLYFPPDALKPEFFRPSAERSVCAWKGTASYHDVVVGDRVAAGAAWYYPTPSSAAARIAGRVAFWRGVKVEK